MLFVLNILKQKENIQYSKRQDEKRKIVLIVKLQSTTDTHHDITHM